jgi:hypothetical protein
MNLATCTKLMYIFTSNKYKHGWIAAFIFGKDKLKKLKYRIIYKI